MLSRALHTSRDQHSIDRRVAKFNTLLFLEEVPEMREIRQKIHLAP